MGVPLIICTGVYPNGLTETPWPRWMARDPWATPSCRFLRGCRGAINRGDGLSRVWEEKRRGVDPRAARSKAFPHERVARCTGVTGHPPQLEPATAAYACIRAWTSAKRRIYAHIPPYISPSIATENPKPKFPQKWGPGNSFDFILTNR